MLQPPMNGNTNLSQASPTLSHTKVDVNSDLINPAIIHQVRTVIPALGVTTEGRAMVTKDRVGIDKDDDTLM